MGTEMANTRTNVSVYDILGAVAASSPVWIFLAGLAWPHFTDVLDGRDVLLSNEKYPNYVRNLFELTSFMATTAILATALWAFVFTKNQIEEARDTRIATLHATLETRWSSDQMLKSKQEFVKLSEEYEKSTQAGTGNPDQKIQDFAVTYIEKLQKCDYARYGSLMSLLDYFEFIGLLEKRGYVITEDIEYMFGTACILVCSVMSTYIEKRREKDRAGRAQKELGNAPAELQYLVDFNKKLNGKFSSARHARATAA
jgi:hypothetical protein